MKLGADDYVRKDSPFELIQIRLHALLRRKAAKEDSDCHKDIVSGLVRIDRQKTQAYFDGRLIELPLTHIWILIDLVEHAGSVRTHRDLMRAANVFVEPNTVVAYIKAIRAALRSLGSESDAIRTERGKGYRWVI